MATLEEEEKNQYENQLIFCFVLWFCSPWVISVLCEQLNLQIFVNWYFSKDFGHSHSLSVFHWVIELTCPFRSLVFTWGELAEEVSVAVGVSDMQHMKWDMWHVTHDLWHVTLYMWHVICDISILFSFLLNSFFGVLFLLL